ncbi:MAG: sugar transferase [Rhodothermales bacterium]|nr:sugar transferase [Rhodothermales bacterium]
MSRRTELIFLLLVDAVALVVAYFLQFKARFQWQWFGSPEAYPAVIWAAAITMAAFWLVLFFFFGQYRERFADSRFDELVSLLKIVTIGILILVFAKYLDALSPGSTRLAILFYWMSVFSCVAAGRVGVRSVQKALLLRGYGTHKTLIIGWSDRVEQIYAEVGSYPEAGFDIVGAIRLERPNRDESDFGDFHGEIEPAVGVYVEPAPPQVSLDSIATLPSVIDDLGVQDVLIALGPDDHERLMEVLRLCDGKPVKLKLVPDFYDIIGGMSRTEHMYGIPLIEVLPIPMPAWEETTKRGLDIGASILVLGLGFPLWAFISILIKMTSPGPIIYKQERVGQYGRTFTMLKFRTMSNDAEAETGPVWAVENDPRHTRVGRWLRRTRVDEIPQFVNVLKGEMSLVGPRPERPFFVEELSQEIPLYNRRHRVKPGITGWAQVKWKYDASLADVRQKVKYDLFYIENMSLRMDFKILFRTLRTSVTAQGR